MADGARRNLIAFALNQAQNLLFHAENNDDDYLDQFLLRLINLREDPIPRIRIRGYFEDVCQQYSAAEFRRHYRLNREVKIF